MRDYPDEENCKAAWKQCRGRVGIACPHHDCKEALSENGQAMPGSLLDFFHDIAPGYLRNRLNEPCRKFNRRCFGETLSDGLAVAGVSYKNELRYDID